MKTMLPPLTPELLVKNLATSLKFYVDLLDFKIEYDRPEENFAMVSKDVARVYETVRKSGYAIKVPLEERWYRVGEGSVGVKQFLIMDPDGYLLRLQQDIGTK